MGGVGILPASTVKFQCQIVISLNRSRSCLFTIFRLLCQALIYRAPFSQKILPTVQQLEP
jgi:hypothetical protein